MKKNILYLLISLPILVFGQATDSINVVLSGVADASTQNGSNAPSRAVDGDNYSITGTRWVSGTDGIPLGGSPEWISVDLGGAFKIWRYHIYHQATLNNDSPAGQPTAWNFQYWDPTLDGGNGDWVDADNITATPAIDSLILRSAESNNVPRHSINRYNMFIDTVETTRVRWLVSAIDTRIRLYELEVYGLPLPGPTAPTNLTLTSDLSSITDRSVNITWTDNSTDEAGYRVQRRDEIFDGSPWETIAELSPDITSYQDTVGILTGASYYYRVANFYSNEAVSLSNEDTLNTFHPNNAFKDITVEATNNGRDERDTITNAFDGIRTSDNRWLNDSGSLPDTVSLKPDSPIENAYGIGMFAGSGGYNNGLSDFTFELYNETTGSFDTLILETNGPSNGIYYHVFSEPVTIDSARMIVTSAHGSNRTRLIEFEAYTNPITWDGSAWSNGSGPTQYDAVFIDGDYNTSTDGDLVAQYIQINEGATVTVEPNTQFYGIGDPLFTSDGSDLFYAGIIQNNGELVKIIGGTIEADTEIRVTPLFVPGVPINLVVVPDSINQQVTITWDDVAIDEVGYLIEKMWTDSLGVDGLDTLGWVVLKDTVTNTFNIDQEQNGVITPRTISFVDDGTLDTLGINTNFYLGRRYQYRVRAHSTLDSARVTDAVDAIFAENNPENLALNKPVTASSVNGSNNPEGAVDGDRFSNGSRWVNNQNLPDWITIDLEGLYEIDRILYFNGSNGYNDSQAIEEFSFQAFNGTDWVVVSNSSGVDTVKMNTNAVVLTDFSENTFITDQVRFELYSAPASFARIYEMQVFGSAFDFPAPTDLAATINTASDSVSLSWVDNSTTENGFAILRKENDSTFIRIDSVAADVTSYIDTKLTANTDYFYQIIAYDTTFSSLRSNEAATSTKAVPPAPTGLVTVLGDGTVEGMTNDLGETNITLTWNDVSDAENQYSVERSSGGGAFMEIVELEANDTTYTDTGLEPGTAYTYRVAGVNLRGLSDYSNESTSTTLELLPLAPSGLTATANGQGQIDLVWTDNADNEAEFVIQRRTGAESFASIDSVAADVTTYSDTGLADGSEYTYVVFAINSRGPSGNSNEATETTLDPIPEAPSGLTASADGQETINLLWTDNSTLEENFVVERSTDGTTFTELIVLAANATMYADLGLSPETTYTYRVAASNTTGVSDFSNEAAATTEAVPLSVLDNEGLSIYPNPFAESLTIRFEVGLRSNVEINLLDVSGKLIHRLVQRDYDQGSHEVSWNGAVDGSRLQSGVYLLSISVGDDKRTERLVIE